MTKKPKPNHKASGGGKKFRKLRLADTTLSLIYKKISNLEKNVLDVLEHIYNKRLLIMTPKQEAYCQAVAEGLHPIDAVKKAGYNPASATKQVYRMNNSEHVQARISELKAINHIKKTDEQKATSAPLSSDVQEKVSALEFLSNTYSNPTNEMKIRIQAAVAALPYEEAKVATKGKKESRADIAKTKARTGRFATRESQTRLRLMG